MKVKSRIAKSGVLALLLLLAAGIASAQSVMKEMYGMIDGVEGAEDAGAPGLKVFNLTARTGYISTPEGNSVFVWGFTVSNSDAAVEKVQYPGPTLLVNQGDIVKVVLTSKLPVPVSMVFPGQVVTAAEEAAPTADGVLTKEALPLNYGVTRIISPGGKVAYTFTAANPGTYLYQSGTRPDLQVDMGLFGAIIVRPSGFVVTDPNLRMAYNHPGSKYDVEYLFLESEIDPKIHRMVQFGWWNRVDTATFSPTYWFINGRAAPDTMSPAYASWLPTQPYNSMPMMEPGQKLLMRVVNAGRDLHPFHQHGNHAQVIARDARALDLPANAGTLDLAYDVFTFQSVPGQTMDGIFTWTGEEIGWDVYGHQTTNLATLQPNEYAPDHGKPFPVLMPELQDLTFGGFWSGSPFLGTLAALPPGEGGMNPLGGFVYMWHSHTEKEMVNNDIFPGGMMTMLVVAAPGTLPAPGEMMGGMQPVAIPPGGIQLLGGR